VVPPGEPISNSEFYLIAERESKNKDLPHELENPLNSQTCEELFNTLAEWNSYLENHIPYFSEGEAAPEELQP